MPYRRFPKTDSARIRALGTLLDYNSRHSVEGRFIDWKTVADVRTVYGKLSTAVQQRKADGAALQRFNASMGKLQHNATLYVSHFLQVLFMCVQRGEIRASQLQLYGLKSANRPFRISKPSTDFFHGARKRKPEKSPYRQKAAAYLQSFHRHGGHTATSSAKPAKSRSC